MNFSWLKDLVDPIFKGVDELVTSDDERQQNENKKIDLQRQVFSLETAVQAQLIDLEKAALEARVKIAEFETKSEHWLVWARRPVLELISMAGLVAGAMGYIELTPTTEIIFGAVLGINNTLRGVQHIGSALSKGKALQ